MAKALILFSGGLDSLLAIKLLEKQGIDCTALVFTTPFFGKEKAEKQAKKFGLKLIIKDISEKHFKIVKDPRYGYGKNMNPCIDCHGFMFRAAGEIADMEGYDIIASGEVLGQRPMSQNKQALQLVRKLAKKDILRPLSAKLLDETSYEEEGLVDRDQLLDISGRSRTRQMQLAVEFDLQGYMSPGGGCLLTEKQYSDKLRQAIVTSKGKFSSVDSELIKHGRMQFFDTAQGKIFVVMGRYHEDNEALKSIFEFLDEFYYLLEIQDISGPTLIVKYESAELPFELIKKIVERVQKKNKRLVQEKILKFKVSSQQGEDNLVEIET